VDATIGANQGYRSVESARPDERRAGALIRWGRTATYVGRVRSRLHGRPQDGGPQPAATWAFVVAAALAQSFAVALGSYLGLARYIGPELSWAWLPLAWVLEWHIAGVSSVLLLLIEGSRFALTPALRSGDRAVCWLCPLLMVFAGLIMYAEPLVNGGRDALLATALTLVLPWLLSMNLLIRRGAWLALAACVLFVVTLISMAVFNACSGGTLGFYYRITT
jgi:hypothetical protein